MGTNATIRLHVIAAQVQGRQFILYRSSILLGELSVSEGRIAVIAPSGAQSQSDLSVNPDGRASFEAPDLMVVLQRTQPDSLSYFP